jgi:hypothetical protein
MSCAATVFQFIVLSSRAAAVINIILRLLYTVLLLASIPLAMWPIEDHLRLALGTPHDSLRNPHPFF